MATITSTGPAVNADTVARALLSGDGTYSLTGQAYRGDGLVVALPALGVAVAAEDGESDFDHLAPAVAEWVRDVAAPAVTSRPAPFYRPRYVGSWVDSRTGTLYLDVVEIFAREDIADAIAAGRDRNQIAIWDAGRGEEIATGGTGE